MEAPILSRSKVVWKFKLVFCLLVIASVVSSFSSIKEELAERKLDSAFASHGQTAQMEMRNYTEDELTGGKDEKKRVIATIHHADIRFKTMSGEQVMQPHYLLSNEFVEKYKQGGMVDMVYLPEASTTIRLAGVARKRLSLVGVSIFGLAGLFLCYYLFVIRR
jgi:hypothetical protein